MAPDPAGNARISAWSRVLRIIQDRILAYDFDPQAATDRAHQPRERVARLVAGGLAVLFFAVGAGLIAAGWVDNKPTTASTGLVGIHSEVTLNIQDWFADGIWWYQRQTPTPLPFTAIGFLFMVVGYSPQAVLILHAALAAWCGYLLFRVCQFRFGAATGLIACVLLYSLPLFVFVSFSGWTFVWATTSLLLAITLLDRYHVSRRIGWYLLAAVAVACAGMSRPENYMVALIAAVFVAAPWRYRPVFILIAFTYPLLQYVHNNVYLGAPPALRILDDARSSMAYSAVLSEWAQDVYQNVGKKSLTPLFLCLGGLGVAIFGVPRRRFLSAILLYFFVAFAAAYTLRRVSFNHEGYYFAHLILLLPFLAHTIFCAGSILARGLQMLSAPPKAAWAVGVAVMIALLAWNGYEERNWLRSRLFFQIRPEIKEARDFIRKTAADEDALALDYVGETSWLLGELESDTGRDIWFYGSSSSPRPKVNAARTDPPAADIQAMNRWIASGFGEWARTHRPKYLFVPSTLEWAERSVRTKTATQYLMFGLRSALGREDFAEVPLNEDGDLLRGQLVFQNERIWVYQTETVLSPAFTLLNASFDDWTGQPADRWKAAPAEGYEVIQVDSSHGRSLRLKPTANSGVSLTREIRDVEVLPGSTLTVQAEMQSSPDGTAYVELVCGSASLRIHPGGPEDRAWHTLNASIVVPADALPGRCRVSLKLLPGATAPAIFDNVIVRVLRPSHAPSN